jgi:polyisoprenoid-binding protein YceI
MISFHPKFLCLLLFILPAYHLLEAQKYLTKTGHAYFMSHTDAIDIDANNNQVAAIVDSKTGEMVVIVLIKSFEFTLATADKHFNETYMESDLYPKATFKGVVKQLKDIDLSKDGSYDVTAEGNLTIHGQTRAIVQAGKLEVKGGQLFITCNFSVLIDDYKIEIPKSVEERVAKTVDIKCDFNLLPG